MHNKCMIGMMFQEGLPVRIEGRRPQKLRRKARSISQSWMKVIHWEERVIKRKVNRNGILKGFNRA